MKVDPGFAELYDREFPAVFRSVLLACGDRQTAEDATQEAFARALVRWHRLEGHAWVGGWVTTTALNVARRQLRRRPDPPAQRGPDEGPEAEARMDVRAAIRALPARQQEAVVLHYLMDLSVTDTAAAMACDEGTVKTHLSRARTALGRTLGEPDDEPTRSPHA